MTLECDEEVLGGRDYSLGRGSGRGSGRAWRLAQDPRLGRYVQATRDISPGQLILAEQPLAWGPQVARFASLYY